MFLSKRNFHQAALCAALVVSWNTIGAEVDWENVLAPEEVQLPPPGDFQVNWRTDLSSAFAEAQHENRPLFVTLRCLPCKQCADFDKAVLEGGEELDPLLTQFITVRLTDARALDLRVFPIEGFQDLDLSWWGYFLSPQGRVYGVYGGRDAVSDATRISKASLIQTLWRVLEHHYHPSRNEWNIDGPPARFDQSFENPESLPGYAEWNGQVKHRDPSGCIHCHQVADILRMPSIQAGTFEPQRDTQVWPLPENIGMTVDRDDGLLVTEVETGSPAARIGIQPGDRMAAAGGRRLFSQADLRGALHRAPFDNANLQLVWLRNGEVQEGVVHTETGWKKTVLDWRMSISQGMIGSGPGFFPLRLNNRRREDLGLSQDAFAMEPFMGKNTTSAPYRAGLRQNHVVTAVDGMHPGEYGRAFLVWFRFRYQAGDEVVLSIIDSNGQPDEVVYTLEGGE